MGRGRETRFSEMVLSVVSTLSSQAHSSTSTQIADRNNRLEICFNMRIHIQMENGTLLSSSNADTLVKPSSLLLYGSIWQQGFIIIINASNSMYVLLAHTHIVVFDVHVMFMLYILVVRAVSPCDCGYRYIIVTESSIRGQTFHFPV